MTNPAVLIEIRAGENEANGIAKKPASHSPEELIRDFEDTFRVVTSQSPQGLSVAQHLGPYGGVKYSLYFNSASSPNRDIEITSDGDLLVNGKFRADHLPVIRQISRDAKRSHKEASLAIMREHWGQPF